MASSHIHLVCSSFAASEDMHEYLCIGLCRFILPHDAMAANPWLMSLSAKSSAIPP